MNNISTDILLEILVFLDINNILNFKSISNEFNKNLRILWRRILERDFYFYKFVPTVNSNYKSLYQKCLYSKCDAILDKKKKQINYIKIANSNYSWIKIHDDSSLNHNKKIMFLNKEINWFSITASTILKYKGFYTIYYRIRFDLDSLPSPLNTAYRFKFKKWGKKLGWQDLESIKYHDDPDKQAISIYPINNPISITKQISNKNENWFLLEVGSILLNKDIDVYLNVELYNRQYYSSKYYVDSVFFLPEKIFI